MIIHNFHGISVAEFKNEKNSSYKISKSYKDKTTNEWKKTDYFYIDDLLKLRAAIDVILSGQVQRKEIADKGNNGGSQQSDPWDNT